MDISVYEGSNAFKSSPNIFKVVTNKSSPNIINVVTNNDISLNARNKFFKSSKKRGIINYSRVNIDSKSAG